MGKATKQAWDGDTDFESMISKLSLQAADFTVKAKYKKAQEKVLELALAYRNYGYQLVEKGDKKMALAQFQKAAEMDKSNPEANKAAGDLLREMGKPKTAIDYYKEALQIDANQPDIWANLAGAYNDKAEYDVALSTVAEGVAATGKEWPQLLHERVVALVQLDRPGEALPDVETILKDWPMESLDEDKRKLYAYVLGIEGGRLLEAEDFAGALPYFERAVAGAPDTWNLEQYAMALIGLGRDAEAVEILKRVLELDPENYRLWLELGNALFRLGRFAEALEAYERVIGNPEGEGEMRDSHRLNYAGALLDAGREADAKVILEQVTQSSPFDLRGHAMLGTVYLNEEDYNSAWEVFEHAVTLPGAESDSAVHYNLGYSRLMMDMAEEAKKAFTEALRIDPKNEQAKAAVKAFGPEKVTLRKRLSGVRERKETPQEMLDRIKNSLQAQRPPWLKRQSMAAIKMGFVKAIGGAFDEIIAREKKEATQMAA